MIRFKEIACSYIINLEVNIMKDNNVNAESSNALKDKIIKILSKIVLDYLEKGGEAA